MRKYLVVFLVLFSYFAYSQQEAQYTNYMFNQMVYNPAFAGAKDAICVTGLARNQWMGFTDADGNDVAPKTYVLSLDAPVKLLHGAIGGSVFQDQLGFEKSIGVKLGYAYRFFLGGGNMSVGAEVGFLNTSIDFAKLNPIQKDDPILSSKASESTLYTDFGFGLYYQVPGKYYVGFSTTQMSENIQPIGAANPQLRRHYYLTGGYTYTLPFNPSFEIIPSAMIKSDGASMQYDITAMVRYENKFWGGLNYRVQDAVSVLLGMSWKNFNIGYAYDFTTSKLGTVGSTGSHEIFVGYCFKIEIERMRKSYKNTRFL